MWTLNKFNPYESAVVIPKKHRAKKKLPNFKKLETETIAYLFSLLGFNFSFLELEV